MLLHGVKERLEDVGLRFPPIVQAVAVRVGKDERLPRPTPWPFGGFNFVRHAIFEKYKGTTPGFFPPVE